MVVYFMVGKSTLYTGMPLPVNYDILVIIVTSILDYNYTERGERERDRERGEGGQDYLQCLNIIYTIGLYNNIQN